MAIAFGAYTTGSNSGASSLTFTSPNVSGSEKIGIVDVFYQSGLDTITGVTWNGSAMTKIASKGQESNSRNIETWYILNPSSGATNIVISRSAATAGLRGDATFYTGAKQSGQPDASATAGPSTGTSISPSVTVVASDSWLHLIARNNGANYTSSVTNGIIRSATSNPSVFDSNGAQAAGSRSMTVNTGSSVEHIGIIISIAPAVAADPASSSNSNFPNLLTLGVG